LIPSRRFLFFLKKTCQRTFVWMPNPSAQALIFSRLFKNKDFKKNLQPSRRKREQWLLFGDHQPTIA